MLNKSSVLIVGVWVSFLFGIFLIINLLDKGIDLPDEGLFFAYAFPSTPNHHAIVNYDLLFKGFLNFFNFNVGIVELRVARLFGTVLIGLVLWFFFLRGGFQSYEKAFLTLSLFAGYGIMPLIISYYWLTLVVGLILIIVFRGVLKKGWSVPVVAAGLGMLCSITFLIRPTTGFLFFGLSWIVCNWVLFVTSNRLIFRFGLSSILLLGGFISVQLCLSYVFPHYNFFNVLSDGREFSALHKFYSFRFIFFGIAASLKWSVVLLLSGFVLSRRFLFIQGRGVVIYFLQILISIFLLLFFIFSHHNGERSFLIEYGPMALGLIGLGYIMGKVDWQRVSKSDKIYFGILFLMPFICVFGSNLYFFRIGVNFCFFWWLLTLSLTRNLDAVTTWLSSVWLLIGSVIIVGSVYIGQYSGKRAAEIQAKHVPFEYMENHTLFIAEERKRYFNDLRSILKRNSSSESQNMVIGMYQMPAEIIFSGGVVFYNPLVWNAESLQVLKKHALSDSVYRRIYPMILAKEKQEPLVWLSDVYRLHLMDSVRHFQSGYVFLYSTAAKN